MGQFIKEIKIKFVSDIWIKKNTFLDHLRGRWRDEISRVTVSDSTLRETQATTKTVIPPSGLQ